MTVKSDKEFIRSFSMVMAVVSLIGILAFVLAILFGWGVDYHPEAEKALKVQRLKPVAQGVREIYEAKNALFKIRISAKS